MVQQWLLLIGWPIRDSHFALLFANRKSVLLKHFIDPSKSFNVNDSPHCRIFGTLVMVEYL